MRSVYKANENWQEIEKQDSQALRNRVAVSAGRRSSAQCQSLRQGATSFSSNASYLLAESLHAEVDLSANCFRHFDEAIQLFTKEEYFQRRDSDFNMTMKNPAHIKARSSKVFKINGPLKTESWVEFCCYFYTANPLTCEYVSGEYPKHVMEILARIWDHASQRASKT
ncbi:hypothetical protein [Alkalisalibacterium limincola]|uniref:hypothetical protein n=1 Tax=Alkalisalibacterium limincola TaxID=2699169 RepID=UPI0016505767|nr:hypothetical protein [Alkalisalibacterium limincola]